MLSKPQTTGLSKNMGSFISCLDHQKNQFYKPGSAQSLWITFLVGNGCVRLLRGPAKYAQHLNILWYYRCGLCVGALRLRHKEC